MKKIHLLILSTGIIALASLLLLSFTSSTKKKEKAAPHPNIIIILADDMGYSDIGCFGSEINTPNLDKLASEGLRLTNFYNAGRCCPSRASLLTGLYPHQAGIGDMLQPMGKTAAYQGYLNDSCVTIAQLLKTAGYHTITSGKWHVGQPSSAWPCNRGFDESFSMMNNGSNYYNTEPLYNDGRTITLMQECQKIIKTDQDKFYMTDAVTNYALNALDHRKGQTDPFFLYVTYTAPHWPLHALPEDIQKYKGKYLKGWDTLRQERYERQVKAGIINSSWPLSPRYEKAAAWNTLSDSNKVMWDTRMAIYAAMVESMDRGIGQIMQKLKAIGKDQNTLIIFLSDNGGSADEVKSLSYVIQKSGTPGSSASIDSYGPEWGNVSNTPFRMFKKNTHEGGIASPFIAWFPGMIKAGSISHTPAHIIDLMPTCLSLAGLTYPSTYNQKTIKPVEGRSLTPILKGQSYTPHETICWEHEGSRAIRKGKWKLVSEYPSKTWELYDLEKDRTETLNLAAIHPELVKELSADYTNWATKVGVVDWASLINH